MYIVILAGGSGTRFWPLSRTSRPKQLISITGGSTMLQRTVERVLPLKPKRILVITNERQAEETSRQLAGFRSVPVDVVAEPAARNTAPAIALAASIVAAHDPSGIMVVLPADHFIRNEDALRDSLSAAIHCARNGFLVTLGIVPTHPETGFGYIEADMEMRGTGPFPVRRFVEKPPLDKALEYLELGNYFWNSGMFVWRADSILHEIERYLPQLYQELGAITFGGDIWELADLASPIASLYERVESVSIDYGVMEKSQRVQVIPAEMGWSDVGSWSALPEVVAPDQLGMVTVNVREQVSIDSSDCLIYGDNKVVATVGVKNLVVVATPDAIMVCDRERTQDVKKVVEELARRGFDTFL